jgi:hypothetical protein
MSKAGNLDLDIDLVDDENDGALILVLSWLKKYDAELLAYEKFGPAGGNPNFKIRFKNEIALKAFEEYVSPMDPVQIVNESREPKIDTNKSCSLFYTAYGKAMIGAGVEVDDNGIVRYPNAADALANEAAFKDKVLTQYYADRDVEITIEVKNI